MNNRSYNEPAKRVAMTGADQLIVTGDCVFMGLSLMDENAGQVKVQVYDGLDDTGVHLLQMNINAGGNDHDWFGPNGIKCDTGLFLKVYSGTATGSIFYK